MNKLSKGFIAPILIGVIALLVLGVGTYFYINQNKPNIQESTEIKASTTQQAPSSTGDDFCKIINGQVAAVDSVVIHNPQIFEKYELNSSSTLSFDCSLTINSKLAYSAHFDKKGETASIKIYDEKGNLKQTFPITQDVFYLDYAILLRDDVNFDGYKDLAVTDFVGASMIEQTYWTFNPSLGVFQKRPDLSDLGDPIFDAKNRKISTHIHESVDTYFDDERAFINGKYVVTKTINVKYSGAFGESPIIEIVKELVNGSLATTSVGAVPQP